MTEADQHVEGQAISETATALPSHSSVPLLSAKQRVQQQYEAAGILPYADHQGKVYFLLGELRATKTADGNPCWSDFGGTKVKYESPRHTASRECIERTLAIFGLSFREHLRDFAENNIHKIYNEQFKYVQFFMPIAYADFPAMFEDATETLHAQKTHSKGNIPSITSSKRHVRRLAWVPAADVLAQLSPSPSPKSKYPLRAELISSLQLADKVGFLQSILNGDEDSFGEWLGDESQH